MKARLHDEAAEEFLAAQGWYLQRDRAAAAGFVLSLDAVMDRLCEFPESGSVWDELDLPEEVRRSRLPRYPFTAFYVVRGDTILIVAVAHARRRPGYWVDRLER